MPFFLVAALAPEMAQRGHGAIVNVTTMVAEFGLAGMGDDLEALAPTAPAGRPASPQEIADAIVFLASQRSSFVHGAILPVDGGRVAV